MGMRLYFLLVILGVFSSTKAQDYQDIFQALDSSKVLNRHFYGFALYDIQENRLVVAKNEDKYFTPASNAKVFALYAAIKNLQDSIPGIAYQLRGDSLIFWGTGDPTFLHPKLCSGRVVEFLKNVPQHLYYVPQKAKQPPYRDGWAVEDYQYAFQPELSVFPIYGNVVGFSGGIGRLQAYPAYFDQTVVFGESASAFYVRRKMEENVFEIPRGQVPRKFSAVKPFKYSDELFLELLKDTLQREITMIDKPMPQEVQWLYSQSTREVLREMMVHSDNFLAEQLAYVGALVKYREFDTQRQREDLLKADYKPFAHLISLHDESGLSFYNKVTPLAMIELLLLLDKKMGDNALRNYYFPAGGIDGTLKNTYKLLHGIPYIWAKTGTVHAVYNQSGFIRGRSGKEYAFSFLNNNFHGNLREVRGEVARLMTYIYLNY